MGNMAGERPGENLVKVITWCGLVFRGSEAEEEILIHLLVIL